MPILHYLPIIALLLHTTPICKAQNPTLYIPIQHPTTTPQPTETEWAPTTTSTSTSTLLNTSTTTDNPGNMRSYETTGFSPTYPATLTVPSKVGSAVMASLSSVGATWSAASFYSPLQSAILNAAPSTLSSAYSDPTASWDWDMIVRATWYSSVPKQWQDIVTDEEKALQSVFDGVTGLDSGGGRIGWMGRGVVGMFLFTGFVVGLGVMW